MLEKSSDLGHHVGLKFSQGCGQLRWRGVAFHGMGEALGHVARVVQGHIALAEPVLGQDPSARFLVC